MNFCPDCGNKLDGDPIYCQNCGKRLHGGQSDLARDQREIAKIQIEYKEAKKEEREAESAAAGILILGLILSVLFFGPTGMIGVFILAGICLAIAVHFHTKAKKLKDQL